MNHQQVFRLWLSVGLIAIVCLTFFSNGQAQDAVSPNNSGRVVREKLIESRPTNPGVTNSVGGSSFEGTSPTYPNARPAAGLFDPRPGGNKPYTAGRQSAAAKPVDQSKANAAKLQKAIESLKQANDEEARQQSLETLSDVVSHLFDEDLKRRESEVGDIQNRAAKLKALIDKRKESKDRIVDLQLKIQLNEVEGLGFAVKQGRGRRNQNPYYGGAPGMGMNMMMGGQPGGYQGVIGLSGEDDYGGGMTTKAVDPRQNAERKLREVTARLKQAGNGDRQAIEEQLRSSLEDYFMADLEIREREIKGIQDRVSKLEKLIERRRQAREQVISLQLEVLKNEVDGLGFFSTTPNRSSNNYGSIRVNIPGLNSSAIGFSP